jgi:NADH dehydrogenase
LLALKSLEDAVNIRSHVLAAFEMAEHETDPARRAALLTFVVVGGGPTGVELAGAIAEISRHTLRGEFRHITPDTARIILLESRERLLAGFHPQSSRWAKSALEALGVEVRTGVRVSALESHRLAIVSGMHQSTIDCAITLWAVGTKPSVLGRFLGGDADGRVPVCPDLSLAGYPDVFVVGDLARLPAVCSPDARPVPAMAASASQMGRCAADNVLARLKGVPLKPFQYRDRGQLATIGRHYALAEIGEFRLYGATAWWFWLVVHLYFLIGFRNRLAVAFDWLWSYLTAGRTARVLLSPPPRFNTLARIRRTKDSKVQQTV